MNELISIVIPVYNLENYIEKTLDSVFGQTYKNIEVIVVNDGSKDRTKEIIEKYAEKEPRLKVFNKENGGVTSARLFGIEQAKGEYIGFVDGDDLIDSDMYERLLKNAVENNADISHCGYRVINGDKVKHFYNTGKKIIQDKKTGIVDLLEGKFIEPGLCIKIYRKNLFMNLPEDNYFTDLNIKNNEDLLLNYYLFRNSEKSVYEDFCPYQYFIRDNSAAHGRLNENRLYDPIRVTGIIVDSLKNDEYLYKVALRLYIEKIVQTSSCKDREINKYKKVRNKARKDFRNIIFEYIKVETSNIKKLKYFIAAFFPGGYGLIHSVYLKMK